MDVVENTKIMSRNGKFVYPQGMKEEGKFFVICTKHSFLFEIDKKSHLNDRFGGCFICSKDASWFSRSSSRSLSKSMM